MEKQSFNPPIVCTLQPGELNARASELLPGVVGLATNRTRIEHGLRFEFTPADDTLRAIATMIIAERRCCRFLRFQLAVEPNEGPMTLDLIGPEGAPEFLEAMFDVKMTALSGFGLFAVTMMLVCYACEDRSPWFIFAFAVACALGSAYGFLQGAWPFRLVEAVWTVVALRRWRMAVRDIG